MTDSILREVSPELRADAEEFVDEVSLRPTTLEEYVGQKSVLGNLEVFVKAAKARGGATSADPPPTTMRPNFRQPTISRLAAWAGGGR